MNLLKHRELILQFTKREIASRYRGSKLGILWSIINPLIMLTIYTFVFSEIFKSRWSEGSTNKLEFALLVFSGLIIFNIFADLMTKSPGVIVGNPNYVKKVIFPLEIFPLVLMNSALFHATISFVILQLGLYFIMGIIHWTALFLPLVLLPFILLCLGISWIMASLGVYLRDIGHFITLVVQGLMLLSPIFYPISSIPEHFLFIYELNPITLIVENVRKIMIWGQYPDGIALIKLFIVAIAFYLVGKYFFNKTKGGFADVI